MYAVLAAVIYTIGRNFSSLYNTANESSSSIIKQFDNDDEDRYSHMRSNYEPVDPNSMSTENPNINRRDDPYNSNERRARQESYNQIFNPIRSHDSEQNR